MGVVFATPDALLTAEGRDLGVTDWLDIDQDRITRFGETTGDMQWIHVDPQRAAEGPFGGTIAHGYLTLSLINAFMPDLITVHGVSSGLNIGLDRVRFLAPVRVGSRIRARGLLSRAEIKGAAVQVTIDVSIEIEGHDKPACVASIISRYIP
ncbi:MAG: MaoC family dehydratase [Candidatus Brevundimonas phytovorans]|nr:MaoC family dehydratase [Brevundimonas sp.]WEK56772.1 MAG: MaoC family dehydratase [Brevundimonas sp.]